MAWRTKAYCSSVGVVHPRYRPSESVTAACVTVANFLHIHLMQNDPVKTICSTMFIVSVVQNIKIGDLSQAGMTLAGEGPGDDDMDVDDVDHLPDGTEAGDVVRLSRSEERSLVRDSTAGFAGKLCAYIAC